MTLHQHALNDAGTGVSPTLQGRGRRNLLAIARILWIVLALVLLVIYTALLNSHTDSPSPSLQKLIKKLPLILRAM
jgi:hypothetical protein